jgi:hypothetical protein
MLELEKFKEYIESKIIKEENLKKSLYVYKFIIPNDDFRDIIYMIINGIHLYQPNPQKHGKYELDLYYNIYPSQYPAYRDIIIDYVSKNISKDNVMLPILQIFDYKRWSGRWSNIETFDSLMFDDVANKLGFDGIGRIYGSSCYFYRTESM